MDASGRAIEELYRGRYVRFRDGVATVTGSYDSARDAVQEGFARAFRARAQYRGEGSLEGWVWRIVLRAALELRETAEFPLDELDPGFVDPEVDWVLDRAIRGLPPKRRLVVFLRYFADLPYATIGEICGIDEGTVAATLAQARQALEKTLTEEALGR